MKNNRLNSKKTEQKFGVAKKIFFNWLRKNFNKKNNLMRLTCLAIAMVVVLPAGIVMNLWAQAQTTGSFGSGFISINITANTGLGFSFMANMAPWSVYAVQWTMTIAILLVFLCSNKPYLAILFGFAFLGGVFNVIDRACGKVIHSLGEQTIVNAVVDYFKFNFNFAIFNVPDMAIVFGIIGGGGTYFIISLVDLFKAHQKIENKKKK